MPLSLTEVKMSGFKSFVDPTTVKIDHNLTCIVGPNGCGKSNTIDAIRFVMGASSAKQLRGAPTDVIFNGSDNRKPVGQASVELVFDNSDGSIGGQYSSYATIAVRRTITRDGTSTYFLNGTKCRRKDVQDILMGTGLGPRGYAIIEQGMISRFVEAKPDELRAYIEEAAGTAKCKERKRETENRMKHTAENLARVSDMKHELEKQCNKLRRQREAAEQYKELRSEEIKLRGEAGVLEYKEIEHTLANSSIRITELERDIEQISATLTEAQTGVTAAQTKIPGLEQAADAAQRAFYEIGNKLTALDSDLSHMAEKIEAMLEEQSRLMEEATRLSDEKRERTERLATNKRQIAEFEESYAELQMEAQAAEERFITQESQILELEAESEKLTANIEVPQAKASDLKSAIAANEDSLLAAKNRLAKLQESLKNINTDKIERDVAELEEQQTKAQTDKDQVQATIEECKERFEEDKQLLEQTRLAREAVRDELVEIESERKALEKITAEQTSSNTDFLANKGISEQTLGDIARVRAGYELAFETALAHVLDGHVVDNYDIDFSDLAAELVLLQERDTAVLENTTNLPRLADFVEEPAIARALAQNILLADDLASALGQTTELPIVTKCGKLLTGTTLYVSHKTALEDSQIYRRERIAKLLEQEEQKNNQLANLDEEISQLKDATVAADARLNELGKDLSAKDRTLSDLNLRINGRKQHLGHLTEQKQEIAAECSQIEQTARSKQDALTERRAQLTELLDSMSEASERRTIVRERLETARSDFKQVRERAREMQTALNERLVEKERQQGQINQDEERLVDLEDRLEDLASRREEVADTMAAQEKMDELKATRDEMLEQHLALEEDAGSKTRALANLREEMHSAEKIISQSTERRLELLETKQQLVLDRQKQDVKLELIKEQLTTEGYNFDAIAAELTGETSYAQATAKLSEIKRIIERLGPINMAALEEYDAAAERFEYLDKQYQDLHESLQLLENAIAEIDAETKERFASTFNNINENFIKLFPQIFGGGRASLSLHGEDMLDAGVSIMAQPPGKKNASISLLSGGEKALTAIALVFSIFKLNPAPFCLLDEVDAPLDDANVGRFCRTVQQMSESVQFIFITHNKITMEMADVMMGVTMREPGVSRMVSVNMDEAAMMAEA